MNTMITRVRNFLTSEDGPTAVEYAVLVGLIVAGLAISSPPAGQSDLFHVQQYGHHNGFVVINLVDELRSRTLRSEGLQTDVSDRRGESIESIQGLARRYFESEERGESYPER